MKQKKLTRAQFQKLSKARQKMIIAQDVLDALKSKKLVAEAGVYCSLDGSYEAQISDVYKKQPECHGCAVGCLFMCYVARVNAMTFGDVSYTSYHRKSYHRKLLAIFDERELALIESFFESCSDISPFSPNVDDAEQALFAEYGSRVEQKFNTQCEAAIGPAFTAKLRAICESIIENKGAVVLPKVRGVRQPSVKELDI